MNPGSWLLAADEAAFVRVSRWHSPVLDEVMPPLTRIASHSVLWMLLAAGVAVKGRRERRAALVGVAAIAVTSATANIAMKGVARRPRPSAPVPERRRLAHPKSSSFPSGHAASAAAFSGAVGGELAELRVPLDALAAAVAFSRVYTGVHYPGDVVAGWVLGRMVARVARRVAGGAG